jgi:hypothetical protein
MTARPERLVASILAVLSACLAHHGVARAQPPRVAEHTVREGETCASIARRYFGSGGAYDLLHEANPELGPPPHSLAPGTVLRIPMASAATGPEATLAAAHNDVRARPPGGAMEPARAGAELVRGHHVETGEASSAQVRFRDRSRVDLRENTLVIVYGGSERLARVERRATLERGALRGRLAELAGRFEVETPGGVANVARADAIVAVAEDGTSRLANLDGRDLTITSGDATVRIPAGTGTVVARGRAPLPPRPLPAAPRWQNDLAGRFVGLTGVGGTLSGSFEPVEGASRYRIEIAREPDGGDVIAALEVPGSRTRFEVGRIPAGVYYVSVATIDEALLEGRPSPRRAMQVLEARIIPPGGGAPVEAPYDPGDPSRARRAPRVLTGTWIVSPVGFVCAAANEVPRGMATLRTPGLVAVHCFDPGGREVPAFDVVVERPRLSVEPGSLSLARGETREIVFSLASPHALPTVLDVRGPPGVEVTAARTRPDGRYALTVTVGYEPPPTVALSVGVSQGNEHVPLAVLSVLVAGAPVGEDSGAEPIRDPRHGDRPDGPPSPPRAFAIAAQSSVAPLDAYLERGLHAETALAVITSEGGGDPLVRASLGARARLFELPLSVGFDWIVDATSPSDAIANGGNGDVRATVAVALPSIADALYVSLGGDAWFPTGAAERGLTDVRFLPAAQLDLALVESFVVRTRHAALLDTSGEALAWAWAAGADFAVVAPLRLGVELDATIGRAGERELAAFAVTLGGAVDVGPVEVLASGRVALGDDGVAVFGGFGGSVALRLRVDAL